MPTTTVHIVSTFPTEGEGISRYTGYYIDELRKRAYTVTTTRVYFLKRKLSTVRWLRLLGAGEPIMHLQYTPTGSGPLVYLLSVLKKRNGSLILTSHELPSTYAKHLPGPLRCLFKALERALHNAADTVTVHTKQHRNELIALGVNPLKVKIIPFPIYPVPTRRCAGRPNPKCGIVYGRITPKKGIEVLFDALPFLSADLSFSIIGPAAVGCESYTERLKQEAKRRGIGERVTFFGYLDDDDVTAAMEEAGFAIFPYQYVTQSAALMTAIGHQLPYIASDLPAFRETHEHHKGGVLFETGNPQSLAHAIELVTANHEVRGRMIHELSLAPAACNWQTYTDAMVELYENR